MPTETATLTISEVSAKYGVSRRTIARRIRDGGLTPVMKLPGRTGTYVLDAEQAAAVLGSAS